MAHLSEALGHVAESGHHPNCPKPEANAARATATTARSFQWTRRNDEPDDDVVKLSPPCDHRSVLEDPRAADRATSDHDNHLQSAGLLCLPDCCAYRTAGPAASIDGSGRGLIVAGPTGAPACTGVSLRNGNGHPPVERENVMQLAWSVWGGWARTWSGG